MYSREIDGKPLTLAASGWTYDDTFVLCDSETGTLWYPLPGVSGLTGISGPHRDQVLKELRSVRTSWSAWRRRFPETKCMRYLHKTVHIPGFRPGPGRRDTLEDKP